MTKQFNHTSVLLVQLVESLNLLPGQTAVDCTAGGGGHTALLLEKVGPTGLVIAIDQDDDALTHLNEVFKNATTTRQLILHKGNFASLGDVIKKHVPHGKINGLCADLGVSSHQLDTDARGFSFRKDAPLDMRMDQTSGPSAYEFVNQASYEDLLRVIRDYGEEPKAHFIAKAIVHAREQKPIATTLELAALIRANVHYKEKSRVDLATKTFQALRIHVNQELSVLEQLIESAPSYVLPNGRLAMITFHSLEDRIVKHGFQTLAGKRGQPVFDKNMMSLPVQDTAPEWRIIKPFPITPSSEEAAANPRARSAKLRVIEKT